MQGHRLVTQVRMPRRIRGRPLRPGEADHPEGYREDHGDPAVRRRWDHLLASRRLTRGVSRHAPGGAVQQHDRRRQRDAVPVRAEGDGLQQQKLHGRQRRSLVLRFISICTVESCIGASCNGTKVCLKTSGITCTVSERFRSSVCWCNL